jgi:hypothetical protein
VTHIIEVDLPKANLRACEAHDDAFTAERYLLWCSEGWRVDGRSDPDYYRLQARLKNTRAATEALGDYIGRMARACVVAGLDARLPDCVVASCDSKGTMHFIAQEFGVLAGLPWSKGDRIDLCAKHANVVYRSVHTGLSLDTGSRIDPLA